MPSPLPPRKSRLRPPQRQSLGGSSIVRILPRTPTWGKGEKRCVSQPLHVFSFICCSEPCGYHTQLHGQELQKCREESHVHAP